MYGLYKRLGTELEALESRAEGEKGTLLGCLQDLKGVEYFSFSSLL